MIPTFLELSLLALSSHAPYSPRLLLPLTGATAGNTSAFAGWNIFCLKVNAIHKKDNEINFRHLTLWLFHEQIVLQR